MNSFHSIDQPEIKVLNDDVDDDDAVAAEKENLLLANLKAIEVLSIRLKKIGSHDGSNDIVDM